MFIPQNHTTARATIRALLTLGALALLTHDPAYAATQTNARGEPRARLKRKCCGRNIPVSLTSPHAVREANNHFKALLRNGSVRLRCYSRPDDGARAAVETTVVEVAKLLKWRDPKVCQVRTQIVPHTETKQPKQPRVAIFAIEALHFDGQEYLMKRYCGVMHTLGEKGRCTTQRRGSGSKGGKQERWTNRPGSVMFFALDHKEPSAARIAEILQQRARFVGGKTARLDRAKVDQLTRALKAWMAGRPG